MRQVARELGVVIPVSFFERAGQAYFNSVAIVDADGALLGVYRKSHIPDGPGYEEKFYFRPGDTGFRVWPTRFGVHRRRHLLGPVVPRVRARHDAARRRGLLYPTAIGSEPHDPDLDTRDPWQRAMIGHAVSNIVPVVAANRVGVESGQVVLRLVVHRRPARRQGRRARPVRDGRDRRDTFDLDAIATHAGRLGLLPRPPPRALRRARHGRRQDARLNCPGRRAQRTGEKHWPRGKNRLPSRREVMGMLRYREDWRTRLLGVRALSGRGLRAVRGAAAHPVAACP
jgi:hypothetical protein